jgi:hypothetical protein
MKEIKLGMNLLIETTCLSRKFYLEFEFSRMRKISYLARIKLLFYVCEKIVFNKKSLKI